MSIIYLINMLCTEIVHNNMWCIIDNICRNYVILCYDDIGIKRIAQHG